MNIALAKAADEAHATYRRLRAHLQRVGHNTKSAQVLSIDPGQLSPGGQALLREAQAAEAALDDEAKNPTQPQLSVDEEEVA